MDMTDRHNIKEIMNKNPPFLIMWGFVIVLLLILLLGFLLKSIKLNQYDNVPVSIKNIHNSSNQKLTSILQSDIIHSQLKIKTNANLSFYYNNHNYKIYGQIDSIEYTFFNAPIIYFSVLKTRNSSLLKVGMVGTFYYIDKQKNTLSIFKK